MNLKPRVEIKNATEEMLDAFFGSIKRPTTFALVAVENEKVVFVGGLFHVKPGTVVLFSDAETRDWMEYHPVTAMKMTKRLLEFAAGRGWKVISYPDESIEKAEHYLEHFGFVRSGDSYEWIGRRAN